MSAELWKRALHIQSLVEDLDPEERDRVLVAECAKDTTLKGYVLDLLAEVEALGGSAELNSVRAIRPGEFLGPYQVLKLLSSGGMGEVYLALRTDDARLRVDAVKILPADQMSLERLTRAVREGETLRKVQGKYFPEYRDHGNFPDGRPYLAMEYIDGLPLDAYCQENRLSLKECLQLFRRVCGAVSSAHQLLFLHRDLKPSNILVTSEGIPKILDFGIAKALTPEGSAARTLTIASVAHFSPDYASPEQVAEETLTTASDVYSLGVLLYQLLTDQVPLQLALLMPARDQVLKKLQNKQPLPPSSRITRQETSDPREIGSRDLQGDLDTIVLKALRKDPHERYQSVDQLSEDIRRFSQNRPILAQKPTLRYRARKFLSRNKLGIGVAALFLVTIGLAVGTIVMQYQDTVRERDRGERVTDFIVELFSAAAPDQALGEDLKVADLVEEARRQLEWKLIDEPLDRAEFLDTLGRLYTELGAYDSAKSLLSEALSTRTSLFGSRHRDSAASHLNLGWLLMKSGEYEEAKKELETALSIYDEALHDQEATAECHLKLATLLELKKEHEPALEHAQQALEWYESTKGADSKEYASTLSTLATIHQTKGDYAAAEPLFQNSLEISRSLFGERHPEVSSKTANLGLLLREMGRYAEAEEILTSALAISTEIYGPDHIESLTALNNLALVHVEIEKTDEAEREMKEVLEGTERALGADHHFHAQSLHNLAYFYNKHQRFAESEPLLLKAIALKKKNLGLQHPSVATSLSSLAIALKNIGRFDEAEPIFQEALGIYKAVYGEMHPNYATVLHNTSRAYREQGNYDEAQTLAEKALAIIAATVGQDHRSYGVILQNLGLISLEQGNLKEAEDHFLRSLAIRESVFGKEHKSILKLLRDLEKIMVEQGRDSEAQIFRDRIDRIELEADESSD